MEFLHKVRAARPAPGNVFSWASLEIMRVFGLWRGTCALYLKAWLLGVEIGPKTRAHGPVGLLRWPGGHIKIGAGASFISSWRRATACALAFPCRLRVFGKGARIEIGPGSQLSGVSITARSTSIVLGKNVLMAPNCIVVDSDFHAPWPPQARTTAPGMENDAPVSIGDFAWIGMGSIILKGVTIGRGAIVGAGSVVTRDVPDYCLACGAPAKVVRNLAPAPECADTENGRS